MDLWNYLLVKVWLTTCAVHSAPRGRLYANGLTELKRLSHEAGTQTDG